MYAKQKHQVRQTKHQVRQTKHKVRQPKYQVRQTKHQVRNFNQKSTPKKQILIYAVLSRCNFCRKFTHFSGIQFTGQKMRWRTQNDKYQICEDDILPIKVPGGAPSKLLKFTFNFQ